MSDLGVHCLPASQNGTIGIKVLIRTTHFHVAVDLNNNTPNVVFGRLIILQYTIPSLDPLQSITVQLVIFCSHNFDLSEILGWTLYAGVIMKSLLM